ncbi:MAG: isovaleryl-CoA dehydrogenase [Oceanococcaceae bacterium]
MTNVGSELVDSNLYLADAVLQEAVHREGGAWAHEELTRFGAYIGTAAHLEAGHLANRYPPELDTHDRFGRRVDQVRYHPAYHQLMRTALENGIHADPWRRPQSGAHVVRGAKGFMHAQVEAGHGCPITMTFAAIPSLRQQPSLAAWLEPKVLARAYDSRDIPLDDKGAITVGMGMTEKQGGSDVRANTTRAEFLNDDAHGPLYRLTGHKWFLSAPMCDLFLVLAQAPGGLTCFAVPRWRPDGAKNPLHIIRLKDKMGNKSNASSEVEFRDAWGWRVGDEGRGVPTIIEMVSLTRFDCMGASAGLMRMGVAQAMHHCQQRSAFGRPLSEQPLMRNVLADLALEYEGAMAMTMRLGRALDAKDADSHEARLARLMTAVGKYWVCKRAPQHSYEVMECIGGSGVMENAIFPRLYREAVINPIWEGSGNVQCLDVLRAIGRDPTVLQALRDELQPARGGHRRLDHHIDALEESLQAIALHCADDLQFSARRLVDDLALAFQGALLVRHAPNTVSDAWCAGRLGNGGHPHYGALPAGTDVGAVLERADPAAGLKAVGA